MANLIPEINPDEIENSTERLFAKLLVEHLPSRVKSGWSQMTHFAFKSMQEASDVCSRWLSAAAPSGFGCEKQMRLVPGRGARIVGRVVVRWCRRSRYSTTGYRL